MKLQDIYPNYRGYSGGGDKGTAHSYIEIYAAYLDPRGSMLEIGVNQGHSLAMWQEYFTGEVIGLNINLKHIKFEVHAYQADATDPEQVRPILKGKQFTYILDDGSHQLDDQVKSLALLWDYLEIGGTYIIEDIKGQPELDMLRGIARELGPVKVFDFRDNHTQPDDLLLMVTKL